MTPVRAVRNQYRGINAHLHSFWQQEGGWDGFHANHIADLMRLMRAQLLPMGYIADIQQSLQIRRFGEPAGKPESDVTIYDTDPKRSLRSTSPMAANVPVLKIPDVISVEEELAPYSANGIYEYVQGKTDRGEPVAWIEFLSPSNKPGGQDAAYYRDKRLKLLHSGIVFVEIDYLHESPPTFDRIAPTHPYYIFVVDPRPVFIEGLVYRHPFEVDDPIPVVNIPLNDTDVLPFDFGAAYNKTYEETLYGAVLVDYDQLPLNFDRYRPNDQAHILNRMLAVLKAERDGLDLEHSATLPTAALSLEQARFQFETWQ
jgi:hypothetical protein